jgi:FtsZ-binding cell division protein ZapB
MSMDGRLEELEKAVSRTVRYINKLQKDRGTREAAAPSPAVESPSQKPASGSLDKLSLENRRLKEERKEARKRLRSIIRQLDKLK